MASGPMMDKPPDTHPFPAERLGAFLRAMADPEGRGDLDDAHEQEIARLEQGLAEARRTLREADKPDRRGA